MLSVLSTSAPAPAALLLEATNDHRLVVIDSAVADISALQSDVQSTSTVLLLERGRDGVLQIAEALEQLRDVSSLHIVAHGSVANLQLGNAQLNFNTLDDYAPSLQRWASALRGADLLVYGCEVAAGSMGQLFLQQLHQLTGANIAASTQIVGHTNAGSNWTLDARIGIVGSAIAFSEQLQQRYSGHFIQVSLTDDKDFVAEGDTYTLNFTIDDVPPDTGIAVLVRTNTGNVLNAEFNLVAAALGLQGGGIQGLRGIPLFLNAFDTAVGIDGEVNGALPPGGPPYFGSITLPVIEDNLDEGPETVVVEILAVPPEVEADFPPNFTPTGAGVTIDPLLNTVSVTIVDDASQIPIVGTDGDDRLRGDNENNLIFGGLGEDRLFGRGGNDRISGGEDDDTILAGSGNDVLSGDEGDDVLLGGDGDDILMGVTGNDVILGGGGSDIIVFGNGDGTDSVIGFSDEDFIGLVDGELTFADLEISQDGIRTVLGVTGTGEILATFLGVSPDSLTADRFIIVPDVSDLSALPDDAPFI